MKHFFRVYGALSLITIEGLGEFSKVIQTLDYVSSLHNCLGILPTLVFK